MNNERQLYHLSHMLHIRYGNRTYPDPTHDPKQVADCYEHEGRQAAMKKFNLTEHWVRLFHRKFYPPKLRGRKPGEPAEEKTPSGNGNYQSTEDLIECKHSIQEIRTFYALLLAGRGKYDRIEDVPGKYKVQAYADPLNTAVKALAKDWNRFRKKQYGKY